MVTGGPGCTGPAGTPNPGVTVASGAGAEVAPGGGPGGAEPTTLPGGKLRGAAMRDPLVLAGLAAG